MYVCMYNVSRYMKQMITCLTNKRVPVPSNKRAGDSALFRLCTSSLLDKWYMCIIDCIYIYTHTHIHILYNIIIRYYVIYLCHRLSRLASWSRVSLHVHLSRIYILYIYIYNTYITKAYIPVPSSESSGLLQ
jgi:hypothetical protein